MTHPAFRLIIAGAAGLGGVLLAASAEAAGWRILGVLLGVALPIALVGSLRRHHPIAAIVGLITISTLVFSVAIPATAILDAGSTTTANGSRTPVSPGGADDGLPGDPQALLVSALDHADTLIPHGSSSILQIIVDDDGVTLRVYDPSNGNAVSASSSGGKWWPPTVRRSSHSRTFARSDLTGLDLRSALPEVLAVARELHHGPAQSLPIDDISLGRRSGDDLLVAEYSVQRRSIQVNAQGQVADTAGAGFLEHMLPTLQDALRGLRIDPGTVTLTRLDFRTVADGSSPIAASSIQISGGVVAAVADGPYDAVTVVPGEFPLARSRNSREGTGFRLSTVTTTALLTARDDLLARHGLPVFDGDLVGLQIGPAPGDRSGDPVLRLQVGPVGGDRAVAVYALDGHFLRTGSW